MRTTIVLVLAYAISGCAPKSKFSALSGPYLGQTPPTKTPALFAPGIISTGYGERIAAFAPDGRELYYVLTGAPHSVILVTKEVGGQWTEPEVAPFSGKRSAEFNMSPDGNKIAFVYKPHAPEDPVWMVTRAEGSWGKPFQLPAHINGYPTLAENGNIYFSALNKNNQSWDLFRAEFREGIYGPAVNLGDTLNTTLHEADPFVSPDESYLIFARKDPKGFGGADLFVTFGDQDGRWGKPVNMGEGVNSDADEYCPTVSPDGQYLFFLSFRKLHAQHSAVPLTLAKKIQILNSPGNGRGDIYWVSATLIEELKP